MRRALVFAALVFAGGFLLLARTPDRPPPEAAAPRVVEAREAETLTFPARRGLDRPRGELFAAPPQPIVKPAPVPAAVPNPVPPPLPYRYAGTLDQQILLSKGDRIFPISLGETLDGQYRVETISAERVDLLYLPLGTMDRIVVTPATASFAPTAIAATPTQTADTAPAELRWDGPARVQAGASFSVALRVSTKEALHAAPMQIRYEPGVLEPLSVQPGKFFRDGTFNYRLLPGGAIFVGATATRSAPGTDAELVVVTFKPLKRGATAELSMSALNLQAATGRTIAHEQVAAFRAAIH